MVGRAVGMALIVSLGMAGPSRAQDDGRSLAKCQKTVGKEIGKYAAAYHKAVGRCFDKIAKERIQNAAGDASGAASSCVAAFRKLENSEKPEKTNAGKAEAKISQVCDPAHPETKASHTALDVLGDTAGATVAGDAIEAEELGGWCDSFGVGGGSIVSVQDWIDCQLAVATRGARGQLVTEYPNAIAWLADVRAGIVALDSAGSCGSPCDDCADVKIKDACNGLDELDAALDANDDGEFDLVCGATPAGDGSVLPNTGQTTSYGTGDDADVGAGLARSFTDNADGTISDEATGLMWEKKEDFDNSSVDCKTELSDPSCANPHDADNRYEWCDDTVESGGCDNGGNPFDGPIVTLFLDQLNNRCNDDVSEDCTANGDADCTTGVCGFAGYRDWRVPNYHELGSIVNLAEFSPAAFPAFDTGCAASCTLTDVDTCSCTASWLHWSSSTYRALSFNAWYVGFFDGVTNDNAKTLLAYARAVRGGL